MNIVLNDALWSHYKVKSLKFLTFLGHLILNAVRNAKIKTISVFIWEMCIQLFPLGRLCLSDFLGGVLTNSWLVINIVS